MALWFAVLVPPVFFFLTVQVVDNAMSRGELGVGGWMLLVALSQVLPLGALLWILFSAAAYTIAPGKLIVHRVASDREISLETNTEAPRLRKGVITLRVLEEGKSVARRSDAAESGGIIMGARRRAMIGEGGAGSGAFRSARERAGPHRTIRLRVQDPERCLTELRRAVSLSAAG